MIVIVFWIEDLQAYENKIFLMIFFDELQQPDERTLTKGEMRLKI